MIPPFNDVGDLPPGGHVCSWEEASTRFKTNDHRSRLWEKLLAIVAIARQCGFIKVLIGGSFPTMKELPDDIDLSWITPEGVTKETVHPDCVALMEDTLAVDVYGWNMLYLPIGNNPARIQQWALDLGFDASNMRDRGTLVLDL
jgi:hypothetical protein